MLPSRTLPARVSSYQPSILRSTLDDDENRQIAAMICYPKIVIRSPSSIAKFRRRMSGKITMDDRVHLSRCPNRLPSKRRTHSGCPPACHPQPVSIASKRAQPLSKRIIYPCFVASAAFQPGAPRLAYWHPVENVAKSGRRLKFCG